jgi:uncharacterized protein YndB with AHSA1/START domain
MDLELRRSLPFPVKQVRRALTDPGELAGWFWPESLATTVEVDLRVGGDYRIAGIGMAVGGEYRAVDPDRLVYTWQWDGEPEETLVTVELIRVGAGTQLTVTHSGFTDDADRDNHIKGWSDCLDRLPGWLALVPWVG